MGDGGLKLEGPLMRRLNFSRETSTLQLFGTRELENSSSSGWLKLLYANPRGQQTSAAVLEKNLAFPEDDQSVTLSENTL